MIDPMPWPWSVPPIGGGEEDQEVEEAEDVDLGHRRYLFFIVGPRPYETSQIERALVSDTKTFGRNLGRRGSVIRINPDRADQELAKTASLNWPTGIAARIRQSTEPLILVIDRDRKGFDPSEHPWAIIWLSEYDPTRLYRVFTSLARITNDDDADIYEYLRRWTQQTKAKRFGKRLVGAVEIKPSVFGISLNVNTLLLGEPKH
jgi:hypothetical protein